LPSGGGIFDETGIHIRRMIMVLQADQIVQKAKSDAAEAQRRVKEKVGRKGN